MPQCPLYSLYPLYSPPLQPLWLSCVKKAGSHSRICRPPHSIFSPNNSPIGFPHRLAYIYAFAPHGSPSKKAPVSSFLQLHLPPSQLFPNPLTCLVRPVFNFQHPKAKLTISYSTFTPVIFAAILYASNGENKISYVDALFNCVSAMQVCGLATVDLSLLTNWQQGILFIQMCIGSPVSTFLLFLISDECYAVAFESYLLLVPIFPSQQAIGSVRWSILILLSRKCLLARQIITLRCVIFSSGPHGS